MFGDAAVAVHPNNNRWANLIGKKVILPLTGRLIPVIADEYADPDKGSGAVKITPAHDFNDFEVGKRHSLEMLNIFDSKANLNEAVPEEYRGLDRFAARKKIIHDLESKGLLEKTELYSHVIPYGDRSGVVIEPWLTDQWYADAKVLAKPAIEAVESGRIKFIPDHWKNTYFEWMKNIQPWCISRQLWWGHRIPAWYGPDGEIFVANSENEAKIFAEEHYGKKVILEQDEDVLDTWFSSGLWPFSTLGWPETKKDLDRYYPNTDLITGFDIIFFWVARMIMLGMHFMEDIPFKNVYIHALVRDEKGQKMSKSRGNVIDPIELIDKYGADALRFTLVSMEAQGRDIKLSENRVEGYRNFATKLWNASRFCESHECTASNDYSPSNLSLEVNRWIIGELIDTTKRLDNAINAYRFNEAARVLYQFIWGTFCDWYLEFSKIPLGSSDDQSKNETKKTAGWVLDNILILLHPIMPFVTEELWSRTLKKRESPLIQSKWPSFDGISKDTNASAEINWVKRLITEVRTVRGEMNVPAKAILPVLVTGMSTENIIRLERQGDIIARMGRLEKFKLLSGGIPKESVQIVIDEATIIIPLSGVIDFEQEKLRLSNEADKHIQEIKKIELKLENKQFIERAPKKVIDQQRTRKEDAEGALIRVRDAQKRITMD